MDRLKFLLQIKTWKLFCVFISIFLFGWSTFFEIYILPIIILLWFCWVVSIGYNGQDLLGELSISWLTKKRFQWTAIVLFVLMLASILLSSFTNNGSDISPIIIIAFALIGMYCFYYVFIASAVVIATIEYKRKADFGSSFGHFLRLLIFPLGVFGIQPILNKQFEELY